MSATKTSAEIAMECRSLHKYLGEGETRVHVLRGVDLSLERGQVSAVVGPSGCGKSTLLYLLGLLDRQDGGTIHVNGQEVPQDRDGTHTRLRCEHIGFVFQFHFLLPEFSALENVMLPMRKLGRLSEEEMVSQARELLSEVGLGQKTHRRPSQLSGGEQQRVAIARSLANRPTVLLADEPTGNLDLKNSLMVFDMLTRLAKEHQQAVLIVTHNPELAKLCDRILRMEDGLFVE
ncbi:ABC transporter ATP-binding protein [Pelagicoccus sp. SDUM812003]|uniref:ABC transporter ATP-binding protein n=1 Tax=Pelagicoccus sp. SDUM812003 TaxID=3041267 RepID=UPI00280CFF9B|nr:ABC transporter ATP-binding protein [Pelagicoccus sp. SDUM812003]MDQ8202972.1 ABC transporter ATP-binding protein [Pelagicoccus sp. SDUM812003]